MKKPKITASGLSIHRAAQAAILHLAKLPPKVRKQMLSLPASQLKYGSKKFHQKVSLPHQKYNLANWRPYGPTMKC